MPVALTQCPTEPEAAVEGAATRSVRPPSHAPEGVPDVRGPFDVWHDEAYLIGWLVRLHGWYVLEPGVLRRRWRPDAAVRAQAERLARSAGATEGGDAQEAA